MPGRLYTQAVVSYKRHWRKCAAGLGGTAAIVSRARRDSLILRGYPHLQRGGRCLPCATWPDMGRSGIGFLLGDV